MTMNVSTMPHLEYGVVMADFQLDNGLEEWEKMVHTLSPLLSAVVFTHTHTHRQFLLEKLSGSGTFCLQVSGFDIVKSSVPDLEKFGLPDPDPLVWGTDPDPSMTVTYHQAKTERKTFILFCDLLMTFYLWRMLCMYLQNVINKNKNKKKI